MMSPHVTLPPAIHDLNFDAIGECSLRAHTLIQDFPNAFLITIICANAKDLPCCLKASKSTKNGTHVLIMTNDYICIDPTYLPCGEERVYKSMGIKDYLSKFIMFYNDVTNVFITVTRNNKVWGSMRYDVATKQIYDN